MKKPRFLSIFIAALILLSFSSCEIKDGMLWYDFEADDAILGVHTEEKPKDPSSDDKENDKNNNIDNNGQSGTESMCQHLNLTNIIELEPTCTESGSGHDVCDDCGKVFESKPIAPAGHTDGNWIIEVAPTTETDGSRYNDCTVCGERRYETIAAVSYSEGLGFMSFGDGTCVMASKGECTDTKIIIPMQSPNGDTVVGIGDYAFSGEGTVLEVIMPDTVEKIGAYAFANSSIEAITFSSSLKSIESNAFYNSKISEVTFPDSLETIGVAAFKGSALSKVTMNEGLVEIGSEAFFDCANLLSLSIPSSVERIGAKVVSPSYISSIKVDVDNPCYRVEGNCLVGNGGVLLIGYGRSNIPQDVTIISEGAFEGNTALTSISLPKGLLEIGEGAFRNSGIMEINVPGSVTYIGDYAFYGCQDLEKIIFNKGISNIGAEVVNECYKLSSVEFYGSADDWDKVIVSYNNALLNSISIDFIEGVAPDSVYYYGATTISGKVKQIYDALVDAVMRDVPETEITFSTSDELTIEDFYAARLIFMSDYPDNFWWGGAASYSRNSKDYLVSLTLEYDYSGDDLVKMRDSLEDVVNEILGGIPDGSVFEKAIYLHDEVAKRITYKFTANDQTPYGALVEGEAVCNGYATAYQMLLQRAGIRAWTVNGKSKGENHAWNVVWLSEDVCVYTDVTWDDQGDTIMHYYFNMSLEEISVDHDVNVEFDLPECGHDGYSYDDLATDLKVLNDHDSAYVLAGFFEVDETGEKKAQFYYYGDDFGKWLSYNTSALCDELNCDSLSYSYFGSEYVVVAQNDE